MTRLAPMLAPIPASSGIWAAADQILAAPTVVRRLPAPIRKLVGDLSDSDRLITGLEIL
jgi:KaiB domain